MSLLRGINDDDDSCSEQARHSAATQDRLTVPKRAESSVAVSQRKLSPACALDDGSKRGKALGLNINGSRAPDRIGESTGVTGGTGSNISSSRNYNSAVTARGAISPASKPAADNVSSQTSLSVSLQ